MRRNLIQSFRVQTVQLGMTRVLWRLLMGRLRPWLLLARIYRLDFDQCRDVAIDQRFDLHVPSSEEFERAYEHLSNQMNTEAVEAALARGDICVAAFDRASDNNMVGFIWGATAAPHGDGLWAAVDAPAIYGYKAFVAPDYRGQRLNAALIIERDRVASRKGYSGSVGFVETHNYPSIQSNIRLGSEPVGYAGYIRVLGRSFPFRSPRARKVTFRFYRHQE